MTLVKLLALALLTAVLALLLRESGAKLAALVSLTGGLALLFYALSRYAAPIASLREMAENAGLAESFSAVLRMLAVGCLTRLASDLCRDMREATLASRVEFCGRAELLLLCLPSLKELFTLAAEVLS